jgi:hypoxanthine phosphoribosyltransferase
MFSAEQIRARVAEIGGDISSAYEGKTLLVVGALTGAVLFVSDLVRHLTVPTEVDFVAVSSYGPNETSSGTLRVLKDIGSEVRGRHVMLVDDIVDTGLTLSRVCDLVRLRHPASLATCVLLDKPSRRKVEVRVDYRGFTIPDTFVVGYGLDSAGFYRNLDYIGVVGR